MKKPGKVKLNKGTRERPQGKAGATGINTPVKREKVPQERATTTYGRPTQTQKL
jgi:hypothetical protein